MMRPLSIFLSAVLLAPPLLEAAEPVDIGTRLELFVDDFLIDELAGEARRRLHHPTPREIVLVCDEPWEGSGCGYHNVFRDDGVYRMYYHGWQLSVENGKLLQPHQPVLCYAESRDGVHWIKPERGIVEYGASKQNNILFDVSTFAEIGADPAHVAVFKDSNPNCPPDSRYKAVVRCSKATGLLPFNSADGLRWHPMADKPVITDGAFDSQNLAFWNPLRSEYRAYFRAFREGRRDIKTCTSTDFLHWSEPQWLQYTGAADEQLYTNQIKPYYRAPHILIGLPTRYIDRGWSASMRALPEPEQRRMRATANRRYGTALTEALLMSSRDGLVFQRWAEAFLRPGPERTGSWAYGNQYIAWQLVETASELEGAPNELSLYANDSYWTGASNRVRRYTLRMDGFVSVNAPMLGGEVTTRPVTFDGEQLVINFATSAAGSIRAELQDADGTPIDGFRLADCPPIFGDTIERPVAWKNGASAGDVAGRPVRVRFVLNDADLYSFRFR